MKVHELIARLEEIVMLNSIVSDFQVEIDLGDYIKILESDDIIYYFDGNALTIDCS